MITACKSHRLRATSLYRVLLFLILWSVVFDSLGAQEVKPARLTVGEIYDGAHASRKLLQHLRVEYQYTTRVLGGDTPAPPMGSRVAIGTWHVTFAYKGEQRYFKQTWDLPTAGGVGGTPVCIFDGTLGFVYRPGKLMMREGKVPGSEQSDMYCEDVLDIPVTDESRAAYDNSFHYPHCLRPAMQGKSKVLSNQEQIDGEWCHVVDYGGQQKLWVDPQIGFALRRKQMYASDGSPLAEYSYSKFTAVTEGLWLPTHCRRVTYPFEKKELSLEMVVEATELAVNNQVTDRDFDPKLPPGTLVTGLGKAFTVRGDSTTLLNLVADNLSHASLPPPPEKTFFVWVWWALTSVLLAAALAAVIYWRWRPQRLSH